MSLRFWGVRFSAGGLIGRRFGGLGVEGVHGFLEPSLKQFPNGQKSS